MLENIELQNLCNYLESLKLAPPDFYRRLEFDSGDDILTENRLFTGRETISISFDLKCNASERERYQLDGYTASMLILPGINHGVFDGINSRELSRSLYSINWNIDKEELFRTVPLAFDVFCDLNNLSQSETGRETGRLLMLKHWSGRRIEKDVTNMPESEKYKREVFIELNGNINDLGLQRLINLLKGKSLMAFVKSQSAAKPNHWKQIRDGRLLTYPLFDLERMISRLPFTNTPDGEKLDFLVSELMCGNSPEVLLMIGRRNVTGRIMVKPEMKTLFFCNAVYGKKDARELMLPEKNKSRDFLIEKSVGRPVKIRNRGRRL